MSSCQGSPSADCLAFDRRRWFLSLQAQWHHAFSNSPSVVQTSSPCWKRQRQFSHRCPTSQLSQAFDYYWRYSQAPTLVDLDPAHTHARLANPSTSAGA